LTSGGQGVSRVKGRIWWRERGDALVSNRGLGEKARRGVVEEGSWRLTAERRLGP